MDNKKQNNINSSFNKNNSKMNKNSLDNLSVTQKNNIVLFKKRTKYELMYEAFYISNLFYEMYSTSNHLKDPYFYIINSEWLLKWKKYVNYDFYTRESYWKNFIKINTLPFRPKDDLTQKENYLNYIKENTKAKIFNFFDSYFLSDNSKLYPGFINNKILLIDSEYKNTYLIRNQLQNNFNYNILNEAFNRENYIWVTEDIWKYLYCIYGGFEIRRHNLSLNNNNYNFKNEIILEPKLETINLIIFHFHKNYKYKIDPPKYLFVSHMSTIRQMKEKLKDIFPYLKDFDFNDIHLWVLDDSLTTNDFYTYIWNSRKFQKGFDFPGVSLEIFDENVKMNQLDKILKDKKNIVLELPCIYSYRD